jgi:cohesin complex subunit SCC1
LTTTTLFLFFLIQLGPGQASALDLGMVNELQVQDQDDDDETRQALGDKEGTAQKWHQHTVKVLQMLQRTMSDNDEKEQQQQVSYDALSKNCSRRTAASVFFELLQLKTWDFIEIDQQDPYGDIEISAGLRFQEAPPNSN